MTHTRRMAIATSTLLTVALLGCGGANSDSRTNTPNDMGNTNAQPSPTPQQYSTPQNSPPANQGTTNGGQPSTGSGTVSNPSGNSGRGGGQTP